MARTADPIAALDVEIERLETELADATGTLAALVADVRTAAADAAQLDEQRHQPNAGDAGERALALRERIATELNPTRSRQRRVVADLTDQLRDARTRRRRLTPPDVSPHTAAVAAAQAELGPLLTEQGGLGARIDEAIVAGDANEVAALRQRARELPDVIAATRVTLLRAQHAHADAVAASFGPQLVEVGDELDDAKSALEQAQARFEQAQNAHRGVAHQADQWRQKARRYERQLDAAHTALTAAVGA